MTKDELEILRRTSLIEEKIKDTIKIEEAYFSQDCNIIIEANLYERGSHKSNIRINKSAFPFIIDALKKYKLELQQQLNEL